MLLPDLPARTVGAGELFQHVSRRIYRATPLHFGRAATNRYDDPDRGYGVLYLAFDLATALMESVFHQHRWHRSARRAITLSEVDARMVRAVGVVQPLLLADLTAPGVMAAALGLNLSQLTSRRYVHTQRVAAAVHGALDTAGAARAPRFDGLLFPSRNNHPAACVAVFDRAADKLTAVDDIALREHFDWPAFVSAYHVVVQPA